MNGSEYIAEFLNRRGSKKVFLLTGGACTFMIDAIARHKEMSYFPFLHEQSAAMAADSLWRINKTVGVTMATSGPGATNLITGIASSYFDSIPTIHITGQVNKLETERFNESKARQLGFQETNIVDMVKPITKYSVQVNSISELITELDKAYKLALEGRKGPVLIDVPMNVQKEEIGDGIDLEEYLSPNDVSSNLKKDTYQNSDYNLQNFCKKITNFFNDCQRPLILFGAGVGLSGSEKDVEEFLEKSKIPFVSSWNGITYFNNNLSNYCGAIGVYGNRGANFLIQNCDRLLVLGSRLDNRQRSGNTKGFAISAKVMVIDIDIEELKKYKNDSYETICFDLANFSNLYPGLNKISLKKEWLNFTHNMKEKYYGKNAITAVKTKSLCPYAVIKQTNKLIAGDAIVIGDTGAALCWLFQVFHRTKQTIFTAGGNSPMGYSLPAAIGAAIHCPQKQIISINGDGGFQINIQELQTITFNKLNIKIIIMNNFGYGIIKQFQDLYFAGRHEASGNGYSVPNFSKIAKAYNIDYYKITRVEDIKKEIFTKEGAAIIDVILDRNTQIEPKLEFGKPIHKQSPKQTERDFQEGTKFIIKSEQN